MKKIVTSLIFLCCCASLFTQTLDPPVAVVKLYETTVIGQKVFREKLSRHEKETGMTFHKEDKEKFLDTMVTEELFTQGAEKQGIHVSEEEVMRQLAKYPGISSDQIKANVEKQTGLPWDKALVEMKKQLTFQQFFFTHPKAQSLRTVEVSDKEIDTFYKENKHKLVAPDMSRISHILFKPNNAKETLVEVKKRAEEVRKKISLGQVTFEKVVREESSDKISAATNGDLGFIPHDFSSPIGKKLVSEWGRKFWEAVFALKSGELSPVLESRVGMHIVKATDFIPHHFLTLNDETYPGSGIKLHDMIKQNLMQIKQEKVLSEIKDELKQSADIKTFPQNM